MKRLALIVAFVAALAAQAFAQFTGGNSLGTPGFTAIKAAGASLACSYTPVTTGTQGTAYTGATPSASGGTPSYTFSETGTLPGGLSISSSTGVISGTPTASGSFPSIQVKVTDSTSTVANCGSAFTLVISAPSFVGAGDINGAASAWYGLRGFSAAYASPGTNCAIDIEDQAGANPLTCIHILSNGNLDVATVSAWVTAHSVTTIEVTKLYDQSGNGLHLVQATLANMPELTLNAIGSLPCITYSSAGGNKALTSASGLTLAQTFTISVAAKRTSNTSFATWLGSVSGIGLLASSNNNAWTVFGGSTPDITASDNSFHAAQAIFAGAASSGYVDGTSSGAISAGTSGLSGNLQIGFFGGDPLVGAFLEGGIWASDKSANNSTMNSNQHTYWGF